MKNLNVSKGQDDATRTRAHERIANMHQDWRKTDTRGSRDVLMNFDLENARRDLIAKREAAGADTPIGHRCSNLIEQLENYRTAEGDQRANLAKSIKLTLKELAIRHQ